MKQGSEGASVLTFPLRPHRGTSGARVQPARKEGRREERCPLGMALGMWYPDLEPRPLCYLPADWSLIQCPAG